MKHPSQQEPVQWVDTVSTEKSSLASLLEDVLEESAAEAGPEITSAHHSAGQQAKKLMIRWAFAREDTQQTLTNLPAPTDGFTVQHTNVANERLFSAAANIAGKIKSSLTAGEAKIRISSKE